MPTLLDATVSTTTANSYLATIADALALLDASANRAAFAALVAGDATAQTTAERYLLRAARLLDMLVSPLGEANVANQSMQWPRYGCYHPSGAAWDGSKTPAPMRIAQAELAAWLASRPASESDPFGVDTNAALTAVKAGPVDISFRSDAALPGTDFVARYILPLLVSWGLATSRSTARLTR